MGRLIPVFLIFVCIGFSQGLYDSWGMDFVSHGFTHKSGDIVAFGDSLWFNTVSSLNLVDVSDPENPRVVRRIWGTAIWQMVRDDERLIYRDGNSLRSIPIDGSEEPITLLIDSNSGFTVKFEIHGDILFEESKLWYSYSFYDISDPDTAITLYHSHLWAECTDGFGVYENTFYASMSGLLAYDISIPAATADSVEVLDAPGASWVFIKDNIMFFSSRYGFNIYDLSDSIALVDSTLDSRIMEFEDGRAYGTREISVARYDIDETGHVERVDTIAVPGWDTDHGYGYGWGSPYKDVASGDDGIIYTSNTEYGLQILDEGGTLLSELRTTLLFVEIAAKGEAVYALEDDGTLYMIDISDPEIPVLHSVFDEGVRRIERKENYLFVVKSDSTHIYTLDFPLDPLKEYSLPLTDEDCNFNVVGEYPDQYFVASEANVIYLYNVTSTALPSMTFPMGGQIREIEVQDGWIYAAVEEEGAWMLNTAGMHLLEYEEHLLPVGNIRDIALTGDTMHIIQDYGVQSYLIADHSDPVMFDGVIVAAAKIESDNGLLYCGLAGSYTAVYNGLGEILAELYGFGDYGDNKSTMAFTDEFFITSCYTVGFWIYRKSSVHRVEEAQPLPDDLGIRAYPNPFNSTLQITAPESATVTIHDTRGRTVADLGKSRLWQAGEDVPSGVYIVRAVVGDAVVDGKCVLIR